MGGGGGGGGQGRPAVTPPVSSHPWDRRSPIPGLKGGNSRTPHRPPDGHGKHGIGRCTRQWPANNANPGATGSGKPTTHASRPRTICNGRTPCGPSPNRKTSHSRETRSRPSRSANVSPLGSKRRGIRPRTGRSATGSSRALASARHNRDLDMAAPTSRRHAAQHLSTPEPTTSRRLKPNSAPGACATWAGEAVEMPRAAQGEEGPHEAAGEEGASPKAAGRGGEGGRSGGRGGKRATPREPAAHPRPGARGPPAPPDAATPGP